MFIYPLWVLYCLFWWAPKQAIRAACWLYRYVRSRRPVPTPTPTLEPPLPGQYEEDVP